MNFYDLFETHGNEEKEEYNERQVVNKSNSVSKSDIILVFDVFPAVSLSLGKSYIQHD